MNPYARGASGNCPAYPCIKTALHTCRMTIHWWTDRSPTNKTDADHDSCLPMPIQ